MSDESKNLWYQLGYALEDVRSHPTADRIQALKDKLAAFRSEGQSKDDESRSLLPVGNGEKSSDDDDGHPGTDLLNWAFTAVSGGLAAQLLRRWKPRARPGVSLVLRAAAAGAGATVLQVAWRRLVRDDPDAVEDLLDQVLTGTVRGLVYGVVAEPRLPGPTLVRGLLYGGAEYFLGPLGGLGGLLGRETSWAKLPVIRSFVDDTEVPEDQFLDHLVFGLALALMAGDSDPGDASDD